jgi:hypothetical protein
MRRMKCILIPLVILTISMLSAILLCFPGCEQSSTTIINPRPKPNVHVVVQPNHKHKPNINIVIGPDKKKPCPNCK